MRPRQVTVLETEESPGTFVASVGPVVHYRRVVTTSAAPAGGYRVQQRVEVVEAIPFWGFLFGPPLAGHLGRIQPHKRPPFWLPADIVDSRAAAALARLATLSMALVYCVTLLTQTITYAAEQFGADKGAQGIALAAVRLDIVLSLPLALLADRRGRRWLVVSATTGALALTAVGAFAPNLLLLAGAQIAARGAANAALVSLSVMTAEEMPAGARAWATSMLTVGGVMGAGICLFALPLADVAPDAWRLLFLLPLAFIPIVLGAGRGLLETRRYTTSAETRLRPPKALQQLQSHRGRFVLLAASGLLLAIFSTPASQFQNEFLRTERGFSGAQISLLVVLTGLPGGIGIVVGGRLAERGRRLVGAAAIVGGVGSTVLMFHSYGAGLYVWSTIGSILGAAAVPALAVYGAELFPTEARGAANGGIGLVSRVGSVIGLVVVGHLADRIGLSRALLYMSAGPFILTVLILAFYPETAHKELEDLNPEDEPLPDLP